MNNVIWNRTYPFCGCKWHWLFFPNLCPMFIINTVLLNIHILNLSNSPRFFNWNRPYDKGYINLSISTTFLKCWEDSIQIVFLGSPIIYPNCPLVTTVTWLLYTPCHLMIVYSICHMGKTRNKVIYTNELDNKVLLGYFHLIMMTYEEDMNRVNFITDDV